MEMAEIGVLKPEKMAPTNRAVTWSKAYLQIVTQKLLDSREIQLDPCEQGWQFKNGLNLSPITTDREVAPENVFKVIKCNCKESANQCGTNRCFYRKNGLVCFMTCGKCYGEEHENKQISNIFYGIAINVQASTKNLLMKDLILYWAKLLHFSEWQEGWKELVNYFD